MRGGTTQEKIIHWLFADRIPITKLLIVSNVLTIFFVGLLHLDILANLLAFHPVYFPAMPWTAFTYPIIWLGDILSLFFAVIWIWFVGGSLERSWGTRVFGLFFFGMSAVSAIGLYAGWLATGVAAGVSGLWLPLAGATIAFAMLNPEQQILFYFFIPLKLKYLAILDIAFVLYSYGRANILLGLFALLGCAFSYWYVRYGREYGRRPRRVIDESKVVRLYRRRHFPSLNPFRWAKEYRERKRLRDFLDRSDYDDR